MTKEKEVVEEKTIKSVEENKIEVKKSKINDCLVVDNNIKTTWKTGKHTETFIQHRLSKRDIDFLESLTLQNDLIELFDNFVKIKEKYGEDTKMSDMEQSDRKILQKYNREIVQNINEKTTYAILFSLKKNRFAEGGYILNDKEIDITKEIIDDLQEEIYLKLSENTKKLTSLSEAELKN